MKYEVIRTCYSFNRLWEKGETAEFPDDAKVPEHFKPVYTVAQKVQAAINKLPSVPEEIPEDIPAGYPASADRKLEDMTVAELKALAENYGIEISSKARKEDIIAAIRGE